MDNRPADRSNPTESRPTDEAVREFVERSIATDELGPARGSYTQRRKVTAAARRMMRHRGYVVVGILPDAFGRPLPVPRGHILTDFGNKELLGGCGLQVEDRCAKRSFIEQLQFLEHDPIDIPKGTTFYRCRLVELEPEQYEREDPRQ